MPWLLEGLSCSSSSLSSSSSPSPTEELAGFKCGVLFDLRNVFGSDDRSIRIVFLLCPGVSNLFFFITTLLSGSLALFRFSDCDIPFSFFDGSLSFGGAVFFSFPSVSCSRFQLLDSCVVFPGAIVTIPGILVVLGMFSYCLRQAKKMSARPRFRTRTPPLLAHSTRPRITVATSPTTGYETTE